MCEKIYDVGQEVHSITRKLVVWYFGVSGQTVLISCYQLITSKILDRLLID
jgi:hypothetical protein